MKLLTVTVPCYNSQDYMEKCIQSLLPGGNRVEIIIIDDGSKDNTGKIADEYARKFPDIVRVIHQENGGHAIGSKPQKPCKHCWLPDKMYYFWSKAMPPPTPVFAIWQGCCGSWMLLPALKSWRESIRSMRRVRSYKSRYRSKTTRLPSYPPPTALLR